MESEENCQSPPTDPPFAQGDLHREDEGMTPPELFRLLVYTKYTALSRFKLVDSVDDRKQFLVLHSAHRTIYKLRSALLNDTSPGAESKAFKATSTQRFSELLEAFKKYDAVFKTKAEDPSKLKVATDESTTISIDYKSFRRSITAKDVALTKLDPSDGLILERCLDLIKSKYDYDFTTLVSHWNIIYQIFLYNDHEVQVATRESRGGETSIYNPLKLNDTVPTIYDLYNSVSKHRSEFNEKISSPNALTLHDLGAKEQKAAEPAEVPLETARYQSKATQRGTFEALLRTVHKMLDDNDVRLNISILKLNKASVQEVAAAIKPVFKEILDEISSFDCDYYPWVSLFMEEGAVREAPLKSEVYAVLNAVLDFSYSNGLYSLADLVVDVLFSFSMRDHDFGNLLQSFLKYFNRVILPSALNYISDLSTTVSDGYNNIWIPSLPNLESVLTFEYLALQYPLITHKSEAHKTVTTASAVPKSGTFVVRLDVEVLDSIDYSKIYQKTTDAFNFKLLLRNRNPADKASFVIRSHGSTFFVSQKTTRVLNSGSNVLSLEILFNDCAATVFTNGTYFTAVKFADKLSFFDLELSYNPENVNIRQYCTLSPGFRKFLIKASLIHHHIFVTTDYFTTITLDSGGRADLREEQMPSARSELETGGYIKKVFDYLSFFAMALSSVHTTLANVKFKITCEDAFNTLNGRAFEGLNLAFELLRDLFSLVADLPSDSKFALLSNVGAVNVVTLWRLLSESTISLLSLVEIFFGLPLHTDELPQDFLENLAQILIEAIKYKSPFSLGPGQAEYHHPIDLVALANTINNISVNVLASNAAIFKQLFSTAPIHVLSEILQSVAHSEVHYVSDLTVLAKNRTLDSLNASGCIEIFTKRALSHVVDNANMDYGYKFGTRTSNFWWTIIYDLLEADKACLHDDAVSSYGYCTCNSRLSELMLLDPLFSYCAYCLRKYFNYFSSITSLNYHMTKLYTSESFCSIPRPSMLLSRLLLKHGVIIMLFNSYSSKYNRPLKQNSSSSMASKSAGEEKAKGGDQPRASIESTDSGASSEFEDYYLALFEPTNFRFIESVLLYLLRTKESILSIMSTRVEVLSKYLLDYFGLLLHNFISCLSLLDLLSYYAEFMESVRLNSTYLLHLASTTCLNLIPYLIKVLLLYNRIFKAYSARYQKFTPFMNYLVVQFSSLLVIFMKFVHFVYLNVDRLDYGNVTGSAGQGFESRGSAAGSPDVSVLKDQTAQFAFPRCATSRLDFNFTDAQHLSRADSDAWSSDGFSSSSSNCGSEFSGNYEDRGFEDVEARRAPRRGEFEICKCLRRLLMLVQDFRYVRGATIAFKNIAEVDAFIANAYAEGVQDRGADALVAGLLNVESWATDRLADVINPVHPHLLKTQYSLAALFIHLTGSGRRASGVSKPEGGPVERPVSYAEPIKYSNQVAFKILSKCQAMNTMQNVKDKDALREAYLEDVRARCAWLIRNTPFGHYSRRSRYEPEASEGQAGGWSGPAEGTARTRTTTFSVADFFRGRIQKADPKLRRTNSTMHLHSDPRVQDSKVAAALPKRTSSICSESVTARPQFLPEKTANADPDLDVDMEEIVSFLLNGPSELECEKGHVMLRVTWLIRLSLLSSVNALVTSFLDVHYTKGAGTFRHNFRPLVLDLLMDPEGAEYEADGAARAGAKNMNQTLELFWYIVIQKMRSLVLCTLRDSKFDLVNGAKHIPNVYARVVYEYLAAMLESVCDWYIRSGITSIDSTNYTKVNMNFWLEISISFFSLLYSLGIEPMTDARYSYQVFNHLFSILHPLPMAHLRQAMSNQTSLSCYTIEAAIVVYIADAFAANFAETVENLFACLKTRKFTKKDQITLGGGTLHLLVRRSSRLPDLFKSDQTTNLKFRHLWSFPKIARTTDAVGRFLIYNFDSVNTSDLFDAPNTPAAASSAPKGSRSGGSCTSMQDNDIILWRMENSWYLITEVSLSKRTSNNVFLTISSTTDISVFLTLSKNMSSRKSTEIELPLVNYLGGSLQVEGINGTWSQVVGFTRFDDLYKMRVHLYHLMKYLLWVDLGTNLYTNGQAQGSDNMGLVLKILFKYLRSTALQIFKLGSNCNCKDRNDSVSIKYRCSNIATGFKHSKDVQGYLVDSDDYTDKPLISRSCSICSSNLIYKKEMDFFWGNILSCLIDLVSFCNNYDLVYLVLNSLLTTFTLGERQVQAFLSMDYLGQRFCNLLVVAIKQLSSTSSATRQSLPSGPGELRPRKFGVNNFTHLKSLLAAPKIHGVFVLKWLPPLKQVPLECIYATLRENFQSILISKPFKPTTNIEPNDPFVTLPHSEHFVTHRTGADFEADIAGNTLQVIRANNMGGIVMYRIPTGLGSSAIQLSTNFYILNASRFGITVAPADCVFGTVNDLFERNDVVGFSHSNSLPFASQVFAATIGYSLGDVLTAHFTIDNQEDGQLCLRTELLIGGNSIGSVLEVVYDPITQNDLSRRMSLVFIFQDPATILLQSSNSGQNSGSAQGGTATPTREPQNPPAITESNIINTFLSGNMRRERQSTSSTNDRSGANTTPGPEPRTLSELQERTSPIDRIVASNSEVVRSLDRLVSRETSGTFRSTSVREESIPVSNPETAVSVRSELEESGGPEELDLDLLLKSNVTLFDYATYFDCTAGSACAQADPAPAWDVTFDTLDQEPSEDLSLTLCKDEYWDKLLRDDKYTTFFGHFSDSVQIYQSVLCVNVPMFSGLRHELVSKVVSTFRDLHALLSTNFKYSRLESTVRDAFSWLCVLCCEYDRDVWDKMASREFKVVSDFSLPFLLGSSFASRTTLISLSNELLLELLNSIGSILAVRLVTTTVSICSTRKGSLRFMHGDVQTDALVLTIGAKCLLASTLILKVLAQRGFTVEVQRARGAATGSGSEKRIPWEMGGKLGPENMAELLDGLLNFAVYFLSCSNDDLVSFNNTTEDVAFEKLEACLSTLGVDVSTLNTQASYRTSNNTLQSVELLQLDELWNSIYNSKPTCDLMESLLSLVSARAGEEGAGVKTFATADKNYHFASRVPSVRRHFMRRSQFYNLIEHDVFDMLQSLVQVFGGYFRTKMLSRSTTVLGLFRSSLVHYSTTFDPDSLDYWDSVLVDHSAVSAPGFPRKMDLFSRSADPLYGWQLLIYSCYSDSTSSDDDLDSVERIKRLLMTELVYSVVLAVNALSFAKLLESVYWILDTLVRHPLCPVALRRDLTNKGTLSLLYYLFKNGLAAPPKLAQVSARVAHNVLPSLSRHELERLLFLTLHLGSAAYMRVHSVCNFYATPDLDMFTNFDHKRHDHTSRLATANIMHSFLTTLVLLMEALEGRADEGSETLVPNSPLWQNRFADFYNMGLYLYLSRNRKLTRPMLCGLLGLPVELSTELEPVPAERGNKSHANILSAPQNVYTSFETFGPRFLDEEVLPNQLNPALSRSQSPKAGPTPLAGLARERVELSELPNVYCLSCSTRYFGLVVNFAVESPTRLVLSQYSDFSKVFAELVVPPTRTLELKPGFFLLDEYTVNVPYTKYRLALLGGRCTYRVGYSATGSFYDDFVDSMLNQVYKTEHQAYLVTDAEAVVMYVHNDRVFWEFGGSVVSMDRTHVRDSLAFIQVKEGEGGDELPSEGQVRVEFDVIIPVNTCFVTTPEDRFSTRALGGGRVVVPFLRTGLSVHKTKVAFPNVALLDLSTSSLVRLEPDLLMTLKPDDALKFDPCLPFTVSFKFERGFDAQSRGFYLGLVSRSEKLLWYSSGDLYVSTNFHVPSKNNEYRRIKCLPYSEADRISVSFDPSNSSLYFTRNGDSLKLNFYNYYCHITNVHTNELVNSNKDAAGEGQAGSGERESSEDGRLSSPDESEGARYEELNFTCADRRSLINAIIFDDMPKIKHFLDYPCELFENGCDDHFDLDGDDYFLFSPIYIVANLGKLSMLKLIATNKNINFDVKSGPFKTTPLMGAVKAGHYAVVYYLLTIHSLDINALDAMGNNCLYYAVPGTKVFDYKIAELLLNFGVRVQPSEKQESVLDSLESISGSTAIQRKLLEVYKLQTLQVHKANWPLLQNVQVLISSKAHVKFKIKLDPPILAPPASPGQSSPSNPDFQSPDRRPEEQPSNVFDIMGSLLGSIGEGVKEHLASTVDMFSGRVEALKAPAPAASAASLRRPPLSKSRSNSITSMVHSISGHYDALNSNLTYSRPAPPGAVDVAPYLLESMEIIRVSLLEMLDGVSDLEVFANPVSNDLNLTSRELIVYYLCSYAKAIAKAPRYRGLTRFIALTNALMNDLDEMTGEDRLLLRYLQFEHELGACGLMGTQLNFENRLHKSGRLLRQLGVLDCLAQHQNNFVYVTTNRQLMGIMASEVRVGSGGGQRIPIKVGGSLYTFDALRLALNQSITFETDRCLVSLLDLLRNSNKKLATLVKILVFSNSCTDVQKYLPPSDSQLWSNVNLTIDQIYNSVRALRSRVTELLETYRLSHIDLQLMHTVLCRSLQELDLLRSAEVGQNVPVESRLLAILESLEIRGPDWVCPLPKGARSDANALGMNYTFNFVHESGEGAGNSPNTLSIRPMSSPHLINRVDQNLRFVQPTSASSLYRDILSSTLEGAGSNVLRLDSASARDLASTLLDSKQAHSGSQNDQGLEANPNSDLDGAWDGGRPRTDYVLHCVSLVLLADRLKYLELLSEIFRNVIPIVATLLNQPRIEYRPMGSLLSQPPGEYFGAEERQSGSTVYAVALGPRMPLHYTAYLGNKLLIKRATLNEMYNKIFSLKTLSADRPYFSIRVDRGIAHTTQLLKNSLWFQSTSQILNCNPNILRAKNSQRPFMVVFKGEGSTDFGGPFQELLTCISNEFMSPLAPDNTSQAATIRCQNTLNNYGMHQDTVLLKFSHYPVRKLFSPLDAPEPEGDLAADSLFTMACCDLGACCASGCCFMLPAVPLAEPVVSLDFGATCNCGASELYSESCGQSPPMELSMYEGLGRLCAMCACMMNPLNIAINPIVWKKLLCSNLRLIDLLDCDKISVDLLQRLAALNASGVVSPEDLDGLVFSLEGCEGASVELIENGANLQVSPENLGTYLSLSTFFRLTEGDLGCSFFARGINSVVPIGRLRTLLDPRALEFVVCGDSIVDLSVLRAHTVSYSINLKRDLFDVLARFNNDMLQLFLRFVSGRSRLPHPNSDWCLRLEYDNKTDSDADSRLPTSATCSFRLLMPKYSSLDVMHRRLIYAIENCIAIDLDAHVVHDEMQLSIN